MRWPFMLKRVHEEEIDFLQAVWQEMVDQEYDRATRDSNRINVKEESDAFVRS